MTWSQYIEQDLTQRLENHRPLPCEPTLERLAAHYRVSTRPVRTALGRLRARGLLAGGWRAGSPGTTRPDSPRRRRRGEPKPIQPPMDHGDQIARDLVSRSLRGREIFVREQAMARKFGVSTTTVRQTFHRLAGQGIIEHVPRRGWRLRPLRRKDMDDFSAVREEMECLALRSSWRTLQADDGRRAMEAFLAGNAPAANSAGPPRIDDGFHAWIIRASGNRYILDFFERFGRYYQLLFAWEAGDRQAAEQTVDQHRRILRAILDDDQRGAEAALRAHLQYEHPLVKRTRLIQPE